MPEARRPLLRRRGRIVVRSNAFAMPGPDDPHVERANEGFVIDLADAWREAARQQRRVVALVVAPSSGATTALRQLAASAPEPVVTLECRAGENLDRYLDTLQMRSGTMLVDDAHRLGGGGVDELLQAIAAAGDRAGGPRGAVVCRRDVFSQHHGSDAVLELHLDPLRDDEWHGLAQSAGPGLLSELVALATTGAAGTALVRRPPLLCSALDEWGAGSIERTLGAAAGLMRAEADEIGVTHVDAHAGVPAPTSTFVDIPAAVAAVGSPPDEEGRWADESPVIEVTVPAFRMAARPVTNAEYATFVAAAGTTAVPWWWDDPRMNQPDQPVVGVSRAMAEGFAAWTGGRLPSETEWERACRAGSTAPRYDALDAIAWHVGNAGGHPHPVGGRAPNALGLHDLLGNAWEWVADDFHADHTATPRDGSPHRSAGQPGTLRGGSWSDNPRTIRTATRLGGHPGPRHANVGFRILVDR